MLNKKILIAFLLCISLPVLAEFTTVVRAYEIALSDLRVPVASSGSLLFKQCAACETNNALMTHNTQFIVNGRSVGLKEFRKSVFQVKDRRKPVIIMHHLQSDTITSLRVTL
jgi:hypothetical protein